MSCQIKHTANILDVASIRRYLFPTDDARGAPNIIYTLTCTECLFAGSDNWLQQCHISACPTGELIALAREKRLLIVSAKWDLSSESNQYQISFSGIPDQNDVIKAVACLPVVGQTQSSHVSLISYIYRVSKETFFTLYYDQIKVPPKAKFSDFFYLVIYMQYRLFFNSMVYNLLQNIAI